MRESLDSIDLNKDGVVDMYEFRIMATNLLKYGATTYRMQNQARLEEFRLTLTTKPAPESFYYVSGKLGILSESTLLAFDGAFQ